jgi:Domain of unknown function (DUF4190)/Toastrack DUF4097
MDCSQCGKEISPQDAFCRRCGAKVEAETPTAPALMPPHAFPPEPASSYPKPSGLAIAALVLGILSFMCLPILGAVLAIVFGLLARGDIKRSQGRLGGRGLAVAGIILGSVNLAILIILAAIFIPFAIIRAGETQTVNRAVQAQSATSLVASLDMRNGKLEVGGGAGDIFEGSFTFNVSKWDPTIDYGLNGSEGDLNVSQGDTGFPGFWHTRNDWQVKFNNTTPLDLTASLASAGARFRLGTLPVTSLVIKTSSGDVNADLSGNQAALDRVRIDGSSGDINLDMSGAYETYIQMDIKNSSGHVSADLRGQWHNTLAGGITNSSGGVELHLPSDVGVRVRVATSSGDIDADGMKLESSDQSGSLYVNGAFGTSPITLQIDVQTSSGDVALTLVN